MLPSDYHPKSPEQFIGSGPEGAASYARLFQKMVQLSRAHGRRPLKILLTGDAGIGKSELVRYLQQILGCGKFSVTKLNGTQVKIEVLEELARSLSSSWLFGDYRLIWIDEADEIPRVAQVRFLTLLDDLPAGVAVACTSNRQMRNFEDRFQSRFQLFELKPPVTHEIELLLRQFVDAESASAIAGLAKGNVRQALFDAQGALQAAA